MNEIKNLKEKFFYFKEFKADGNNKLSPMNTESCRKYIAAKTGLPTESEDILYMIYHEKELNEQALLKEVAK